MMKTNEECNNLIELLKQALTFYADENNNSILETTDGYDASLVMLDKGTQARFALEKIKTFQGDRDEQEKEFVKNMISAIETDESQETILGLIEAYKTQTEINEDI